MVRETFEQAEKRQNDLLYQEVVRDEWEKTNAAKRETRRWAYALLIPLVISIVLSLWSISISLNSNTDALLQEQVRLLKESNKKQDSVYSAIRELKLLK